MLRLRLVFPCTAVFPVENVCIAQAFFYRGPHLKMVYSTEKKCIPLQRGKTPVPASIHQDRLKKEHPRQTVCKIIRLAKDAADQESKILEEHTPPDNDSHLGHVHPDEVGVVSLYNKEFSSQVIVKLLDAEVYPNVKRLLKTCAKQKQ